MAPFRMGAIAPARCAAVAKLLAVDSAPDYRRQPRRGPDRPDLERPEYLDNRWQFGTARGTDNQISGQDHAPPALSSTARNPVKEKLNRKRAEGLRRLGHHRQKRTKQRRQLDIVEADDGHVARNLQPALADGGDRADCRQVVDGEDCAWPGFAVQKTLRRLKATPGVCSSRHYDEIRVERNSNCCQRVAIPPQAVARGRDFLRLGDVGDTAVTESEQVIHHQACPADAVALDQIALYTGDRAIHQHEGGRMWSEPTQVVP